MHGFHTSRHLGLLKQAISPGTTSRPVLGWTGEPAPIRHIFKNHATRFFDRWQELPFEKITIYQVDTARSVTFRLVAAFTTQVLIVK